MSNSLQFIRSLFDEKEIQISLKVQTGDLFQLYIDYCNKQRIKNVKRNTFIKQLESIDLFEISRFYYSDADVTNNDDILGLYCSKKSRTKGFILEKDYINNGFKKYLKIDYDLINYE